MFQHYIKIAFRNFFRHKSSFLINLIGLSTGLACAMLIFLWVIDEMRMDNFFENDSRLFQVMEHQQYADGIMTTTSTPGLLARSLKEDIPEIEYASTVTWNMNFTLSVEDNIFKGTGVYVEPDFLDIFSFNLLQGNRQEVLKQPTSIVLTESVAKNLFGSVEAAIGKGVEIDHNKVFTVSGILQDLPDNTTFSFDYLLPYEELLARSSWLRAWDSNSPNTMVLLKEGAAPADVSHKIADYVKQRPDNEQSNVKLFLKQFSERYLYGSYENGQIAGGRIEYVKLFSVIAIFILIIACINFMNLSTARASRRAKEVGVRKAVGAERKVLTGQYLVESLLITLISFLFAILLVQVFLPQFNLLTNKEISLAFSPFLIGAFLGIALFTGLLAGSYPALYLTSFQAVAVLKGEIRTSLGELWARRGLVVFQFTLSVILIVAVIVVWQQIQFVQHKNLGYNKDQLVYFPIEGKVETQREAFLEQLKKVPGVASASAIAHTLIGRTNNTSGLDWDGKDPEQRTLFEHVQVDYDLLETIDVEMLEGRSFSRAFGADSLTIILNESAVNVMGMKDPIGQKVTLWDQYDLEVIGVVKDFHFQSLHEQVNPLFFRLTPDNVWNIMIKIEAGKEREAIKGMQDLYATFNPGFPLDISFMDEQYAQMYSAEQRVASLSRYFAGLAILISCLGLFGLAAFTADRKKKEVGIRKVLGASVQNIVLLLTRDFTRLVLVAIGLGLPIAYLIVQNWLQRFEFKISISFWFFIFTAILVISISWLTVSSHAFRLASVNPRDCLRDE